MIIKFLEKRKIYSKHSHNNRILNKNIDKQLNFNELG